MEVKDMFGNCLSVGDNVCWYQENNKWLSNQIMRGVIYKITKVNTTDCHNIYNIYINNITLGNNKEIYDCMKDNLPKYKLNYNCVKTF